jgi:putative tryptophan/tyrosine transport system substrate-binding protein
MTQSGHRQPASGRPFPAGCRRSASYVNKILKAAKPADLPVEQATKLELFINLKAAKSLGINVPLFLQQLADVVID